MHALYRVIERPGITLEELLYASLAELPTGFKNEDDLSFSIAYREKVYEREDDGSQKISFFQPILINENKIGHLEVKARVALSETEHDLLKVLAERLGRVIQRYETSFELERSREQFMLAVKGSNDGIWDWDLRTNSLFLSARWKEILGYEDDELPNVFSTFADNLHPDDKPFVEKYIEQYLKGDIFDVYDREFRMRHKDGTYRWIRARGQAVRDKNGTPFRMAGSHTDITSAKEAQEHLANTMREFELIFSNSYVGIMLLRGGRRLARCNQRLAEIFGYENPEQMLGISMRRLHLNEERFVSFGDEYYEKLRQGEQFQVDYQLCRKDGTPVWCTISGTAIDLEDLDRGVIWVIDDLEPRKRAERELLEINAALEAATAKANAMAAQAEMANAAKSEFLANMSHEIRTPINGVLGMLDLLLDTELYPEQQNCVKTAKDSAESLLSLINDILDFSKIEAQKLELVPKDFHLADMIESVCRAAAIKAHEKGLELISDIAPEVPTTINADALRLRQILTNLLGNAIKFTATGEVILTVSLENELDDEVSLTFSVADTGIGIPKEKQRTIFDQFTQADTSTTREYGGTGLGLAISKRLVDLMDGQIGMDSTDNNGSTFWFTVPVGRVAARQKNIAEELKNKRVLVVDDNATNRFILSKRLRQWGMLVTEAVDGNEALKLLQPENWEKCPFDVALLDFMMPTIDGEKLAQQIRTHKNCDTLKLVLLATLPQERPFEEHSLFSAQLVKPFNHMKLKSTLCQLVGNASSLKERLDGKKEPSHQIKDVFANYKGTVLIAEDNITNQKVAQGTLRKLGLTSETVLNGEEAIKALENRDYSLVLMDVQMPILDGIEATKRIRMDNSLVRNRDIPIIAMTARAMVGDREECLKAGMNDYVPKPINIEELVAALKRQLLPKKTKIAVTRPEEKPCADDCFDKSVLLNMLMGDENLAQNILDEFLKDLPKQIDKLEQLLDERISEEAKRQAHSIKGASANVGAKALQKTAKAIEHLAPVATKEEALDLVEKARRELLRLIEYRNRELGD